VCGRHRCCIWAALSAASTSSSASVFVCLSVCLFRRSVRFEEEMGLQWGEFIEALQERSPDKRRCGAIIIHDPGRIALRLHCPVIPISHPSPSACADESGMLRRVARAIVGLYYYWIQWSPLNRGNGAVALAVLTGTCMAARVPVSPTPSRAAALCWRADPSFWCIAPHRCCCRWCCRTSHTSCWTGTRGCPLRWTPSKSSCL
jgi:hypothetical protein